MNEQEEPRWVPRPILSLVIRIAVFVLPIAGAVLTAVFIRGSLPEPEGVLSTILWVVKIGLPATVVLKVIELAGRRLLPLAALFEMSLLFPDEAPSRIALARRSGRVRDLKAAVVARRASGVTDDDDTEAAGTILSLAAALASHDKITRGHSERVRVFVDLIADEMNLPSSERDRLRWAALLHDIGKLTVPTSILNKKGKLHPQEKAIIARHPIEGMKLIAPIAGWLGPWADAVVQHHERFDGLGYPYMVKSPNISLGGRIVAVADSFECITASRPYSKPLSTVDARQELARCAGTQFDPEVVRAFLNISIAKVWRGAGLLSWFAAIPYFPKPLFSGAQKGGRTSAGAAAAMIVIALIAAIGVAEVPSASHASVLGEKFTRPHAEVRAEDFPDQFAPTLADASLIAAAPPVRVPVVQNPAQASGTSPRPQALSPQAVPNGNPAPKRVNKGLASRSGSHGQCISAVARSTQTANKGQQVRVAAQQTAGC